MADRLKMTVAELRERMSEKEFVQWTRFHAVRAQTRELEMKRARG